MAKKTITENSIIKQYNNLKKKHPDATILLRCGDFYETYEEDAEDASKILGITLTKQTGTDIRMAGFPCRAIDTYLPKLIRAGKRVAICDRIDDVLGKPYNVIDEVKGADKETEKAEKSTYTDKQPEDMTIAELMAAYKQLKAENELLKDKQGCNSIELKEAEERASKESEKAQHWMERAQSAEAKLEAIKSALNG